MKLFGLLSLVFATSLGMKLKEPVVNEVVAMVESGLGETKEGRALFITLTLTESTWSVVSTATTDLTTVSSCIATSLTECTTATARSGDEQQHVSTGPAILTRAHTGEKVDVHAIKPSKTQEMFDRMDIDGVIHEHEDPISSGSLSFREVRMENMGKSCGRSDAIEGIERRPRIVIPTVSSAVTNLTSTTYSTTYTFSAPSTLYFGFCKFLNMVMVILSLFITDALLLNKFWGYGQDVLHYMWSTKHVRPEDQYLTHDPRCEPFPTEVCKEIIRGSAGNVHEVQPVVCARALSKRKDSK